MPVRSTAVRSLGVLALVAPLGLALAPSALAATGPATFDSSSPSDGATLTGSDTSVTVSATLPACTKQQVGNGCDSTVSSTLQLSAPGQTTQTVTKKSTTSSQSLSLTIAAGSPNAVWTAALSGQSTRSFTINQVNAPDSFSAEGSGAREVDFVWNKGTESGITGYTLADSNGTVLDDAITPQSANCASSSRCAYGLYYPSDNPGSHGYQLVAKRTSASGGTVTSSPSTTSATLTKPAPSPTPTPAATTGPSSSPSPGSGDASGGTTGGGSTTGSNSGAGTSGSTGGTSSGTTGTGGTTGSGSTGGSINTGQGNPTLPPAATNSVVAGRKAFALTFNAFSPSLGIPKLPPLAATDDPQISAEQPLPIGTYNPTLPYQKQTETTATRSLLSSPTAFVQTITDPAQLAKSIAGALILLLVGAHLRRFLGTHVED